MYNLLTYLLPKKPTCEMLLDPVETGLSATNVVLVVILLAPVVIKFSIL